VGRDVRLPEPAPADTVSIHAPAWGATVDLRSALAVGEVSIHAPAWGATPGSYFRHSTHEVSIHAPAWGATCAPPRRPARQLCFNPRARVGRDWTMREEVRSDAQFQSTRPRGARRAQFGPAGHLRGVSIHAPAWGATAIAIARVVSQPFQSTRPRGARRIDFSNHGHRGPFQSTRPRGARPTVAILVYVGVPVSIHAPAWGATPGASGSSPSRYRFNPRARVGRDGSTARAWIRTRRFNPRARVGRDHGFITRCAR